MDNNEERRSAAISSLESKREFKNHAVVYCAVNALLIIVWAATGAGYFWPIWVIGGWGLGLALHGWKLWGQQPISEAEIQEESRRLEGIKHHD